MHFPSQHKHGILPRGDADATVIQHILQITESREIGCFQEMLQDQCGLRAITCGREAKSIFDMTGCRWPKPF